MAALHELLQVNQSCQHLIHYLTLLFELCIRDLAQIATIAVAEEVSALTASASTSSLNPSLNAIISDELFDNGA